MPRIPSLSRSLTLRAAAAVAALAATVPVAGASGATVNGPAPIKCGKKAPLIQDAVARWQRFPAPQFTTAIGGSINTISQDIKAYAVDPNNENHVIVTNGNQLQISTNGGCSWLPVLRLDDIPSDPQNTPVVGAAGRIVSVYISPSHAYYAMVEEFETGATVGHPHVLYSTTGKIGSWKAGDQGLPPVGHPLTMKAAPNKPGVMYLSFSATREDQSTDPGCPPPPVPCPGGGQNDTSAGLLWRSTDGGRTWASRTDPQDLNGASAIKYFSIEDDDPSGNTLWVVANGLIRKSTNGGSTFSVPTGLPQDGFQYTAIESINKTDVPGKVKLVAFARQNKMVRLTTDEGWVTSTVQFTDVQSVTQLPDGEIVVGTPAYGESGGEIWRIFDRDFQDYEDKSGLAFNSLRTTYGWELVTPYENLRTGPDVAGGDTSTSVGTFYARNSRDILRFLGSTLRNPPPDFGGGFVGAPPPPKGLISPATVTLDLGRDKTKTVEYRMTLPPAPTPIDLFLLLDNSGSMQPLLDDLWGWFQPVVDDVRQNLTGIARSLVNRGVDVNIGVGRINVEPDPTAPPKDDPRTPLVNEGAPKPIYELLRKVGPVDAGVFQALNKLDGNGGSGFETQLESLWQSVQGDGWSGTGLPFLLGYQVQPGQVAAYRDNSIRVVIHATDEQFSRHITNGHNDSVEVARALKDADVLQIGLSQGIQPDDDPERNAYEDLAEMAKLTGAVAPRGGVDCEDDGYVDIAAGQPLVCATNYGLDKTILNLLASISDFQHISIRTSNTPTLRAISRFDWKIDAKKNTDVRFSVTYSCKGVQPGTYFNDLTGVLRNLQVAHSVATVNCGFVPPIKIPEAPPANNPPPVLPNPVVPAVVPVHPIPQGQTQVQTQVNPQAGMAEEEQQEYQVATADNTITEDDDELAMVGLAHDSPWARPALTLGAGMVLTAAGTAAALRRRTRTSVARAQVR